MRALFLCLVCALAGLAAPAATGEARAESAYRELIWQDLLPEGEAERIARLQQVQAMEFGFNHFGTEQMPQLRTFNVVEELDGERVRIAGFVLPFDFAASGEVSRFLLVPFVGACIHVPPPPPNQLIYVVADPSVSVRGLWDPVFAEGVLRTRRQDSDLADTAYTLELSALRPYRS
ncbi:MAG: DUF3299 domain-containing protein [Oceanicaulis sp.]|nr:DUF3299 domain-containing protein [Oceanicaulis sp.]